MLARPLVTLLLSAGATLSHAAEPAGAAKSIESNGASPAEVAAAQIDFRDKMAGLIGPHGDHTAKGRSYVDALRALPAGGPAAAQIAELQKRPVAARFDAVITGLDATDKKALAEAYGIVQELLGTSNVLAMPVPLEYIQDGTILAGWSTGYDPAARKVRRPSDDALAGWIARNPATVKKLEELDALLRSQPGDEHVLGVGTVARKAYDEIMTTGPGAELTTMLAASMAALLGLAALSAAIVFWSNRGKKNPPA